MSYMGPMGWLLPGSFPEGPAGRSFSWALWESSGAVGKGWKKKIKKAERKAENFGKSRQELSFDRCQEIPLEVPLLCWSSCFAFNPLQPLRDIWK